MREFEATGARAAVGDLISVSLLFPQTANCVKMFASGVKRWTARAADLCPRQSEEAACRGIKKEKRHLQSVKVVNYICWRDFCRSECSFLAARAEFEYSDLSQKKKKLSSLLFVALCQTNRTKSGHVVLSARQSTTMPEARSVHFWRTKPPAATIITYFQDVTCQTSQQTDRTQQLRSPNNNSHVEEEKERNVKVKITALLSFSHQPTFLLLSTKASVTASLLQFSQSVRLAQMLLSSEIDRVVSDLKDTGFVVQILQFSLEKKIL